MVTHPTNLISAKQMAKQIREQSLSLGKELSHSGALELLAHKCGHKDWNTMHASFGNQPPIEWVVGGIVEGRYLTKEIVAEIKDVVPLKPGWFRITLVLDEAVDVVTFDSFSNFRKQISTTIGPLGETNEKTSNGLPQMAIRPIEGG